MSGLTNLENAVVDLNTTVNQVSIAISTLQNQVATLVANSGDSDAQVDALANAVASATASLNSLAAAGINTANTVA